MRYRGPVWTKTETEALLNIIIKNNLLKKSDTKGQLSHALVKPLVSKGFERTAVQIRLKLRSLRMSYQKCKKKGCTPRAMKECPYYNLLDKIYADQDSIFVKQEPYLSETFEEPLSINTITNNTNIWIDQEIQTMLGIIDDMCLSHNLSLNGFSNSALKMISNGLELAGIKRTANQVKVALTNLKQAYVKSRQSLETGIEVLTCPFYDYLEKFWGGEKLSRENTKKCEVERLPSIDDAINDVIVGKEIHGRHHASDDVIDLKNGLEHEDNTFVLDDNNFNLDGNNYSLNDDNNYTLDHSSYNVDNNYLLSDNNYPVESIESIDEEEEEMEDEEYLNADGNSAIVVDLCEDETNQDNNVNINNGFEERNGNDKLSNGDDRIDETIEILEEEEESVNSNNNNHHSDDVSDNSSNYTNNRHSNISSSNRCNNVHMPGILKKIVLWTEDEIVTMFKSIYDLNLKTPFQTKVSLSNASKIIEPLARAGYTRSTQQIVSKIKNMRTAYLRCIGQGCTPEAIKECPYFEYLDRIYEQHKKYPDDDDDEDDDTLAPAEPISRRIDGDDTNGFINDKESESGDHSYNSAHIDNDNDADRKFKKPGQDVLWSPVESIVENDVNMRIEDQFDASTIEQTDEGIDQEHEQQEQQNYLDDGMMEHENIEIMDNCELNSSILTGLDPEVSLVQFVSNKIRDEVQNGDEPKIVSNIKKEAIHSDEEVEGTTNEISQSQSLNCEKITNPDIILEHESCINEGIVLTKDEASTMVGNLKTHENSMEYKPVQQMRIKTEVMQNSETPSQTEPQVCENSLTAEFMQSVVQQILKHEEKLQEQHHRWMERQFEIQRQHDRNQRDLLLTELREFRKTIAHTANSNNNFLSDH